MTLRYITEYTNSSRNMLRSIGMWAWPGAHGWRRRLFLTYTAFTYFVITYIFCNNAAFVVIKLTDLNFFVTESWILLLSTSFNIRMITFLMKREDLNDILNEDPIINTKLINSYLNHYKKIANYHSILCAIILMIYLALFVFIYQIIFSPKEMNNLSEVNLVTELVPYLISNPFIKTIVKGYHACAIAIVTLFRVAFSTLFIHMLCYIQALQGNLIESVRKVRIRNISILHHGNWPSTGHPTVIDVKYCVNRHQLIIRLVDKINSVFSLQIMIHAFFSMLQLCFFAAAESKSEEVMTMTQLLSRVVMLTAAMYELLVFSWLADGINSRSSKLRATCLGMLWKSEDGVVGDWKSLEVMAARCETNLQLKAGPFSCLSINTLIRILAMAFSYYVFLVGVKVK